MNRVEKAFDNLLIGSRGEINTRISQIPFDIRIDKTMAQGYCYCLRTDANGNLRLHDLIDYLDATIVDYAIPKKQIDEAKKHMADTGSTTKIMALRKQASELFTDLEKTGEGGEILLYILIQEFLKIPQLISKMTLKTSGKLHYQGADGIHVKYDKSTNALELYWGESKMHKTVGTAIKDCFESLNGFLLDPYSYKSTQERDLQLITNNIAANVNDPELENLLVRYFDKDDDLSNQLIYKGVCFIGFDLSGYPSTHVSTIAEIQAAMQTEWDKWITAVSANICSFSKLDLKEIHVFLMPFPSVAQFREYYLNTIH